jgi:hypothetical protein
VKDDAIGPSVSPLHSNALIEKLKPLATNDSSGMRSVSDLSHGRSGTLGTDGDAEAAFAFAWPSSVDAALARCAAIAVASHECGDSGSGSGAVDAPICDCGCNCVRGRADESEADARPLRSSTQNATNAMHTRRGSEAM